jgi:hypothetical protein
MRAFLERGLLTGGDGLFDPAARRRDRLSAAGADLDYRLTPAGRRFVRDFGIELPARRREVGYCVDWTEQRHHLAGALGHGLRDRLLALDWIRPAAALRAVEITDAGARGLNDEFGVAIPGTRCEGMSVGRKA